jgi:hypothetical protein
MAEGSLGMRLPRGTVAITLVAGYGAAVDRAWMKLAHYRCPPGDARPRVSEAKQSGILRRRRQIAQTVRLRCEATGS